jgi:hypothetical protein
MDDPKIARRSVLKGGIAALAAIPLVSPCSRARATGVTVDPRGARAQDRGYFADNTLTTDPRHKSGQRCGNCGQYAGIPGEAEGACGSFGWDNVSAEGYCTHYVADVVYLWSGSR